jgi:hypothetical protein
MTLYDNQVGSFVHSAICNLTLKNRKVNIIVGYQLVYGAILGGR